MTVHDHDLRIANAITRGESPAVELQQPAQRMIDVLVGKTQDRVRRIGWGIAGDPMHRDRLELFAHPSGGRLVGGVDRYAAIGGHRDVACHGPAIDVAIERGVKAGKVLPLGPRRHGIFEELHGRGIGIGARERPTERERREFADFVVVLAGLFARRLVDVLGINRIDARRPWPEGNLPVVVGRQLVADQVQIDRVQPGIGLRLLVEQQGEQDLIGVEMRSELEPGLPGRHSRRFNSSALPATAFGQCRSRNGG